MYKGMTIIEMILVIIILGMLASVTIYGINAIDSAKLKVEFIKIGKLREAYMNYYKRYGMPKKESDIKAKMINKEFITQQDLVSKYHPRSGNKLIYDYKYCQVEDFIPLDNDLKTSKFKQIAPGGFKIVVNKDKVSINVCLTSDNNMIPTEILCEYEARYDDDNSLAGIGRSFTKDNIEQYSYDYYKCSLPNKQYSYAFWAY